MTKENQSQIFIKLKKMNQLLIELNKILIGLQQITANKLKKDYELPDV